MPALKHYLSPRSIGQRFALTIGAGAGIILIVLAVANYISGRELLLRQTSQEALRAVNDEINTMDDLVEKIAMYPEIIAATELTGTNNEGVKVPWLASILKHSPMSAIYGLYMVRDAKDWRDPNSDTWVDRKSWPNLALLKYDFHDESQDWYQGAKQAKALHVTQPYFDAGGSDIDMVSITKPVYSDQGTFLGVAGVDVALDEMRKIVRKIHIRNYESELALGDDEGKVTSPSKSPVASPQEPRETAYLVSQSGAIIVSPEASQDKPASKPSEQDPAKALEDMLSNGLVTSVPGIQKILASDSGWQHLKDGSNKVIYWAKGRTTGWKLVLEVPYKLIVAPARKLAEQSAIIGGAGLFLLIGVVFFTARKISQPITELQTIATSFEKGSYEGGAGVLERIEKRPDELGRFAKSFSTMAKEIRLREERLSEWNANLEQTVKDRTAELAAANAVMANELAEAATYSRAILPERILKGPVTTDWVFITSSELGGDSFGYHWIDKDHLSLYLLDVCGHGVGAALLSISVHNVLRTSSLTGTDFFEPTAVLTSLNNAFPMEKHNEMYFTAWYGVYSLREGKIRYASAGHPPAVLLKPDGSTALLAAKGIVVGAFPTAVFETGEIGVPAGSILYLFSDGTYEADRPDGTMMTYEEFAEILTSIGGPTKLDSVVAEVRRQQEKEVFADDFSLVEFRFAGDQIPSYGVLKLKADFGEVARLHPFLTSYCEHEGTPMEQVFDFEVILEELVTNVIKYGGVDAGQECCLIELLREGNQITIRFSDWGNPFNSLARDEVDTDKPIEEREIGGLGIHFIKKLTDTQSYEYKDGKNVLTLTKKFTTPADFNV
ncbi:MAG: SpoIIE family protein phosphatase [Verrucomicrobiota bacterium]